MFKLLFLSAFIFSANTYAKSCVKDIFNFGVGFDSAVFEGERSSKKLELISKTGISIDLAWFIFCPDSKIEFKPYFYVRNYEIDKDANDLNGAPSKISSGTLGIEVSKDLTLFNSLYGAHLDIGVRDDFTIVSTNNDIGEGDVTNLLLAIGASKMLFRKKRFVTTLKASLGALLNNDKDVDNGFTSRLSGDFLYKLNKKSSLIFKTFFDFYDQKNKNSDTDISRKEIGAKFSYLFRL